MANSIVNTTANAVMNQAGLPESLNLQVNVSNFERLLSTIGGSALIGFGLTRSGIARFAFPAVGSMLAIRGLSGHCSLYSALGIDTSKSDQPDNPNAVIPAGEGVRIETSVTVNRPVEELYDVWRGLERLPDFMSHLSEVRNLYGVRSHWVAKGPFGITVEWDADIINEHPYEMIAWKSVPGSQFDTAGSVHFEPTRDGQATTIHLNLKFNPPGGKAGIAIADFFGQDPKSQIKQDLERFREIMESEKYGVRATKHRWEREFIP